MRDSPARSHLASASSRMATARPESPARASASASAIFNRPSKNRMFCSRSCSTPRRMSSRPLPLAPLAADVQPSRNTPNARNMTSSCSRARRTNSKAFGVARRWSPRINSNMAAYKLPDASVLTWVRPATRVFMRSTSEIARSISPRGHEAAARLAIAATPGSHPKR